MYVKHWCPGCERIKHDITKEHVFPIWLLHRCGVYDKPCIYGFDGRFIEGKDLTLPVCNGCNALWGRRLESPIQNIFNRIEVERKVSYDEAELLIRWMWKIQGMFWHYYQSRMKYAGKNMTDRITNEIENKEGIGIAIALIENPFLSDKIMPVGLDVYSRHCGILTGGVFSRLAIVTYSTLIEQSFSLSTIGLDHLFSPFTRIRLSDSPQEYDIKIGFQTARRAIDYVRGLTCSLLDYHQQSAFTRSIMDLPDGRYSAEYDDYDMTLFLNHLTIQKMKEFTSQDTPPQPL
jgi:hypothetical protein